jgi:uncharacterized protein YndB with AHSA1/START domain
LESIRQSVSVRADVARVFQLFTEEMGTWWPLELYSRAVSEFERDSVKVTALEFQGRPDGLILEHLSDGKVLPWGKITAWEPPRRVVMAWRPHPRPEPPTEVEVTFSAGVDGTLVEVDHRGWERLSQEFHDSLYETYARGWVTTLDSFTAAADTM